MLQSGLIPWAISVSLAPWVSSSCSGARALAPDRGDCTAILAAPSLDHPPGPLLVQEGNPLLLPSSLWRGQGGGASGSPALAFTHLVCYRRTRFMRTHHHSSRFGAVPRVTQALAFPPARTGKPSDCFPPSGGRASTPLKPAPVATENISSPRCNQKGCVFPATLHARGICAYHLLQEREPGLFRSFQPSSLLLEQARFGVAEAEPDDSRVKDRRRRADQLAMFLWEDAA